MCNIIIGQSGGPTAVINTSLYGVLSSAKDKNLTVYGMVHGIEGFLNGEIINLSQYAHETDLELLRSTPASFLGSCRYKLPADLADPVYAEIFRKLQEYDIGAVLYIGGNDSMDTVDKLSRYAASVGSAICFLGIPKTIDNDLVLTDHTPGFGSTAKYVAATVRDIVWDAGVYAHPVVTIVELMGRNAGWVTASSVLARTPFELNPIYIYLPEVTFCMETFLQDLQTALQQRNSVVVCVSEGIRDKNGKLICEYGAESTTDQFGHKMLTGCGKILERYVKEKIGCKCRSIEINLPQRCSGVLTSRTDTTEAEEAGRFALEQVLHGETGKMVSFCRSEEEYRIRYRLVDVASVCNQEKKFPEEWILSGNDVAPEFREYVYPLIQGENTVTYQGGLPKLLKPAYLTQKDCEA